MWRLAPSDDGDDGGRRPGPIVLGNGHPPRGPEGLGHALHRGEDLGLSSRSEVAIGHRDA